MPDPKNRVVSVRIKSAPALCRLKGDSRLGARGDADRALAHIKRIGPAILLESLRPLPDVGRWDIRAMGRLVAFDPKRT